MYECTCECTHDDHPNEVCPDSYEAHYYGFCNEREEQQ